MEFPQTTSGLTQAPCSSLSITPEQPKQQDSRLLGWLMEVQESRGSWYTEKMARYYTPELAPRKSQELVSRLAGLFDEYQVTDAELKAIKRRVRESEFRGSSYSPLPTEDDLIRIIKDVQAGMVTTQASAPEPYLKATETKEDVYGVTVCGDGEKIVRDYYFFRNLFTAGVRLFGSGSVPGHWLDEAAKLMKGAHRMEYDKAQDDARRQEVLSHYYQNIRLPDRQQRSLADIERLRDEGIRHRKLWSRYEPYTTDKKDVLP